MDFEFTFGKELEEFRKEVQEFIKEHAYKDPIVPPDPCRLSVEMFRRGQELNRLMGQRGWFAPGYPTEYGGGGLSIDHCVILAEELGAVREERRWPGATEVSSIMTGGIMEQGTEEQKKRYLPGILQATWIGWQCFTEPDAGTDEASMKSTAVRDGDVYLISGTKVFVGQCPIGAHPGDYLYWPAVTDPSAPRHENISAFFIPADLPGITYNSLDLIAAEGQKWEVVCDNTPCPADHLVGIENKGWLVTQSTLDAEHGGGGAVVPRSTLILRIIEHCKTIMRNGRPISSDPLIKDQLVKLYSEYQVGRLWGLRNFAMAQGNIPRARYTGTQTSYHGKRLSPLLGKVVMDMMGDYCIIDDPELQILLGEVEHQIRLADVTHIAGTPETQRIQMSRALGLGRGAAQAAASR
jgi:alkylation response protein AidB-like acyl-CoA dehydrogenase